MGAPRTRELDCALCVVGAGIAGLNALWSAKPYLGGSDHVVVVDRRPVTGGMWNDAYDYVRLHQPHPMFTVGDLAWTGGRHRSHLATRAEVTDHLTRCAREVFDGLSLTRLLGTEYLSHDEVPTAGGASAVVHLRDAEGGRVRVRAKTLIKAFGFDVRRATPLPLASAAVRSVPPHDAALFDDDAPVFVIGSGKTAMDTVLELLRRRASREVRMIAGSGTVFLDRAKLCPPFPRSLLGGSTGFRIALDISRRFDGTNGREASDHLRDRYGLSLLPGARHNALGIASRAELDAVREGLREVTLGHLAEVRDEASGPIMQLLDGRARAVPEGSYLVNCTGYLDPQVAYEPFRSPGGAVLSVTPRSALHFLTTHGGFLLPHLHYRGELERLPLYELDTTLLRRRDKTAWASALYVHGLYNMAHILDALPASVLGTMGVNLDNWFPVARRLWDLAELKRRGRDHAARAKGVLDRLRAHHDGVRCGPLPR